MTLEPLSDHSLTDRVAGRIRDAIHEGRYPPGARLVERTLAAELGVSHIPVREALTRLTDEGLVERAPRRGARVATLSPRELEELSSLRIVLERFVVTRVQERLTAVEEKELRRMVASMRQAAVRGDYRRVFDLDQRFHERLWELADHRMLGEVVTGLRGRISAFLRAATAALEPDALERHAASHDELLEAITSGDAEIGRAEMTRHIELATERLRGTLDEGDGDD
ncbi:DNA-binding transcriptional regulator, GntR family [Thermomonospora echinospora]|uniref:DNA-binding transcriptional regulator, GntR family n=1 Tax=Thermomonospora echinospora TaxID=1992 RepID=A0A1H6D0W6_9ACTN|nr:GntR family transcriptional regulator [Thermomonospora echinospora]SEG78678.1 DNA-binding transcriptional regulator, GntR family [Thermomonospora echinospora]